MSVVDRQTGWTVTSECWPMGIPYRDLNLIVVDRKDWMDSDKLVLADGDSILKFQSYFYL